MNVEKIKVRTESGQLIDVAVLRKGLESIEVVIGEGVHNMRCELKLTRNGKAYAGSVRGREIVYERTREQVEADLKREMPGRRDFSR